MGVNVLKITGSSSEGGKETESRGMEGGRRPTGIPLDSDSKPDPEVAVQIRRRRLSVSYKIKVLDTVAALKKNGGDTNVGAYLRSEGLYYSSIRRWERLRKQGLLTKQHPGVNEKSRGGLLAENKKLRRKLERVEKKLHKTELIVELQKKISLLLGLEIQDYSDKDVEK